MVITFFGHASLYGCDALKEKVKEVIREHISVTEKVTFYCGEYGDFDRVSAQACRELKKEYPQSETVFVTPYFASVQQKKIQYLMELKLYDATVYPPLEEVPLRFAISKRNEWMAEKADLVIAYVACSRGGAYKALQFARRKKKTVINLFE